jgi:hypothetical protein
VILLPFRLDHRPPLIQCHHVATQIAAQMIGTVGSYHPSHLGGHRVTWSAQAICDAAWKGRQTPRPSLFAYVAGP